MPPDGLLRRVAGTERPALRLEVDGRSVEALAGDTLLTAILLHGARLRHNESDGSARAGFCLMGACQDCWVSSVSGERFRACSTPAAEGMRIVTWPRSA
jgi:D-hydroxyproline dehydrogenase subunit gamma